MPSKVRRRPRGRKITRKGVQLVKIARPIRRKKPVLSGFPMKKMVRLRYCQEVQLNAGAIGFAQQLFRCNSCFDPDFTGIGHQPKGYDEWASIYDHYTVMSSTIEAVRVSTSNSNVPNAVAGILLDTSTTGVTSYSGLTDLLESKLVGKGWNLTGQASAISGASTRRKELRKSFNSKRFFGIKNPQDGSSYSASISANPAQDAYFVLWNYSIDSNDPGEQAYIVTIDYTVEFRDPKSLSGS